MEASLSLSRFGLACVLSFFFSFVFFFLFLFFFSFSSFLSSPFFLQAQVIVCYLLSILMCCFPCRFFFSFLLGRRFAIHKVVLVVRSPPVFPPKWQRVSRRTCFYFPPFLAFVFFVDILAVDLHPLFCFVLLFFLPTMLMLQCDPVPPVLGGGGGGG